MEKEKIILILRLETLDTKKLELHMQGSIMEDNDIIFVFLSS